MVRVTTGVLTNQDLSLDPLGNYIEVHGFAECIVHSIPSRDKDVKDVKTSRDFLEDHSRVA